ncbi:MAG: hypothetical protein WED10_07820 [Brumimicrobium sp.]
MRFISILLLFVATFLLVNCDKSKKEEEENQDDTSPSGCQLETISASSEVEGFGIMDKLPGIWNGPVTSPTPLGSFNEWIVDFRPISSAQISAKNELDSINDIFMSFFVVKYDCSYKIAFRNGGGFAGQQRNSYMIIDSLSESQNESFYRFVDPVSGGKRVFTDVIFKQDSLIMHTYTNKYNTLQDPVTHMIWRSVLKDEMATEDAITSFGYPQKKLVKDFSTSFDALTEAIFYSPSDDPYPESEQPYLGNTDVNITVSNPGTVDSNKKIVIIITSEPLFDGFTFNPENLDFRSRYVFINAGTSETFNFNYMHPGDYYVNAIYDENGDYNFSSGDYMNGDFDKPFSLSSEADASVAVDINFEIP